MTGKEWALVIAASASFVTACASFVTAWKTQEKTAKGYEEHTKSIVAAQAAAEENHAAIEAVHEYVATQAAKPVPAPVSTEALLAAPSPTAPSTVRYQASTAKPPPPVRPLTPQAPPRALDAL
jgi:hypothetical protein